MARNRVFAVLVVVARLAESNDLLALRLPIWSLCRNPPPRRVQRVSARGRRTQQGPSEPSFGDASSCSFAFPNKDAKIGRFSSKFKPAPKGEVMCRDISSKTNMYLFLINQVPLTTLNLRERNSDSRMLFGDSVSIVVMGMKEIANF